MRLKGFVFVALCWMVAFALPSCMDMKEDVIVSEKIISGDEHWTSDVKIDGVVKVQRGATLTVEPGVTISFGERGSLVVGNDGPAVINIAGTSKKPVRFDGGRGIQLLNVDGSSQISHCRLSNMRGGDYSLSVLGLSFRMKEVEVSDGGGVSIKESLAGGRIDGLTIRTSKDIALSVPANYKEFIGDLSVTSGMIHLAGGGNGLTVDLDGALPYLVTTQLNLEGEVKISGATIYFDTDASLELGARQPTNATLKNVKFYATPTGQRWRGLTFGSGVNVTSRMEGCEVKGARIGVSLYSDNVFTIKNCDFNGNDVAVQIMRNTAWNAASIASNNTVPGGTTGINRASGGVAGGPEARLPR